MSILDRYILRRYLKVVAFTEFAFLWVFIIVDIFDKMDKFIDKNVNFLILARYYYYELPYIITLVLPVALLISSFFSIGEMAKHFEIISMKVSGRPLWRILAPLFIFGLVLSMFMIWMTGELVPRTNRIAKKIEDEEILGKKPVDLLSRNSFSYLGSNNLIYWASHFDGRKKTLKMLEVLKIESGNIKRIIIAEKAEWRDGKWVLFNGYERNMTDNKIPAETFSRKVFDELTVTPEDLGKPSLNRDEMTITELVEQKEHLERLGQPTVKELVDYHIRIAFPFSDFIMIFLGAPLSAMYRKKGNWVGFIFSIITCFLFFALIRFSQTLGYTGNISPVLSAWITNIIFFTMGTGFLLKQNMI